MTRKDLITSIIAANDGMPFITRKNLAKILGHPDPHSVDPLLAGLDRINGRYFVADVADHILNAAKRK